MNRLHEIELQAMSEPGKAFGFRIGREIQGSPIYAPSLTVTAKKLNGAYQMTYRLSGEKISNLAVLMIVAAYEELQK